MEKFDFKDTGPFEGQTFKDATRRLREYPQLINNFADIISNHSSIVNKIVFNNKKRELAKLLQEVNCCDDFKKKITCDLFLSMIESSSIDSLTGSGFKEAEDKPRIYISNHRDIVLDDALLCLLLYRNNLDICDMVIGDNLLANQFITDMFKCNGAITIKRSLSSARELKEETLRLSRYIRYSLETKKKSVWIAQKSGRSKDGIDNTSPAILKMLYLSYREDGLSFSHFLEKMPIMPVAISYQYDPCDVSKGHEEIRKLREEGCYNVYKKKKYQDILDVIRGIRMYKGNVHIALGTDLKHYEDVTSAVREIDRQIHENYNLWDSNYFAYDYINGTSKYAENYKDMNTKSFIKHYECLNDDVVQFVLNEYANPVVSMEKENENKA